MKRTRLIITAVVVLAVSAAIAAPAIAQKAVPQAPMTRGMGRRACGGFGPQFTLEQQEQIEKIHQKHNDERTELTNRLKVMALEMKDIVGSDKPDFKAIEKKMEDMAAVRLDLAKLRLRIHQDIRPLLDDDQRVLFDRNLGRHMGRGGMSCLGAGPMGGRGDKRDHGRMHGRMSRECRMSCMAGPGHRPMRGGMGMGPAAAAGTCPRVLDVEKDVEELE
jgi:Spy/CpxP family protein refolding chaperone